METRLLSRVAKRIRLSPGRLSIPSVRASSASSTSSKSHESFAQQAIPIGDYYSSILSAPTLTSHPAPQPPIPPPPPQIDPVVKVLDTKPVTAANIDPAIVFASRTVKLRERKAELDKKAVKVAGVWVPAKPEEPDDCCMSGCVNCVWDRYQEEMEEWVVAKNAATKALAVQKAEGNKDGVEKISGTGLMLGKGVKGAEHTRVSMDYDGGGSESNWGTDTDTGLDKADLFKGVPVGIREFMRLEKSLKEKTKSI